ncbi:MAG: efflux RND transporter periplasmic adaptor subunit [Candidatus Moranbacteria bacterium]|jgi:RND family efflux transporter MFP subunit|nr:efflux RND transporter periplasmic adaptor subunit [Candidatus Moranbacteria bacterium]
MFGGKKKIIVGIILLAGIGGIWYWWQSRPPKALWVSEPVVKGDVRETVSVVGRLEPNSYADLSFLATGMVDKILVAQGAAIQKGDIVAVLDTTVLQSEGRKAAVALSIAEENEKLARRSWDDLSPEEKAVKKLTTKQARENIRTIWAEKKKSSLVAPIDGTLSKLDVRIGETVTLGKVIGRVSGAEDFLLKADVPEADIDKVVPGKEAEITFDALSSDEKFVAKVTSIEPSSTVIQDVIYYTVTFGLQGQDARLKEGMSANIDVMISQRKQVLMVPYRSLGREGGRVFVEIANDSISSERRFIETGVEGDDGSTEVLSGIREGERVIVSKIK